MTPRFDHAVIVVERLEHAVGEFGEAGFTVTPGGRHDVLPTENALIVFADGGYLELLGLRDAATRAELRALRGTPAWDRHLHGVGAVARRFLPRLAGAAGVGDFAVHGAPLARFAAESRRRGVALAGPVAMERTRADGERLAWQVLLPDADALPFLIEDRTPRERRVPADSAYTSHANGGTAVVCVRVRCASVALAALAYADLFGARLEAQADGSTLATLGAFRVELVEGEPEGACAVRIAGLSARGDTVAALGVVGGP